MQYHVERSTTINADLAKVRELIADFSHWNSWSPWTIVEPDCKMDLSGKAGEAGHKMAWDGKVIGSGTNTLVAADEQHLSYELAFFKPFKSEAKSAFALAKDGDGTKVTWTLDSSMPWFLFFMVDMMRVMIGMDYDRGLRMIKEIAEHGEVKAKTEAKGVVDFDGFSYVGIKRTAKIGETGPAMKQDYERIIKDVIVDNGKKARHWAALYPKFNAKAGTMTYIAAISDEDLEGVDLGADYVRGEVKTGKMFQVFHHGAYDFLGNAWSMGMMHVRAGKHKKRGIPFEYYHNSPLETAPEDLETSIYFPVKG